MIDNGVSQEDWTMRNRRYWQLLVLGGLALLLAGRAVLSGEAGSKRDWRGGALVPVMSTMQDSPEFVVDFTNDTGSEVDITVLLEKSVAVLDGKDYSRHTIKFVGNPALKPGRTHTVRISLAEYLPGSTKLGYSAEAKRWRWRIPVAEGRHTLLLKLGNRQYGPVAFAWEPKELTLPTSAEHP